MSLDGTHLPGRLPDFRRNTSRRLTRGGKLGLHRFRYPAGYVRPGYRQSEEKGHQKHGQNNNSNAKASVDAPIRRFV
jgi:hypothetical protein